MNEAELKQKYNETLEVIKRGSAFMDDNSKPIAEREAKIPAFQKLIDKTCNIADELKRLGVDPTDEEYINGFVIGGG